MSSFPSKVSLVGVPFDQKSSFLQGVALAPPQIRATLHNGSANYWSELDVNVIEHPHFEDIGDIEVKEYFDQCCRSSRFAAARRHHQQHLSVFAS